MHVYSQQSNFLIINHNLTKQPFNLNFLFLTNARFIFESEITEFLSQPGEIRDPEITEAIMMFKSKYGVENLGKLKEC